MPSLHHFESHPGRQGDLQTRDEEFIIIRYIMRYCVIGYSAGAFAAAFLLAQGAYAQDPAPGLQDLVGARGGSGEQVLQERG